MIKEKFNLTEKVAIVTGASKGIGKAIALGLAEFGAGFLEAVEHVGHGENLLTVPFEWNRIPLPGTIALF